MEPHRDVAQPNDDLAHINTLNVSRRHIETYQICNQRTLTITLSHSGIIESPVAQWLMHPARSWRVVDSNPIWNSDVFLRVDVISTLNIPYNTHF